MIDEKKEILKKIVSKNPSKWIEESKKRIVCKKSMFENIIEKLLSEGWKIKKPINKKQD